MLHGKLRLTTNRGSGRQFLAESESGHSFLARAIPGRREGTKMVKKDDRDILDVLKFELDFIEKGGYGRSVRAPWRAPSIFQDSPSCLNFSDPARPHPCKECLLIELVPADRHFQAIPCHHIPLTVAGDTVDSLERWGDQQVLEEVVKAWLRGTIERLEEEQANSLANK